jgi:YHS domain-containing protein
MNIIARYGLRIFLATVVLLAFALYLGCGSKETAETPAKQETAAETTTPSTPAPQDTMQTQPAEVDWSAYANPKPGVCPGCNMTLDPASFEVATIGEKQYACCSAHCATLLAENPEKYLAPEASGEE